jgi:hypothetical protein
MANNLMMPPSIFVQAVKQSVPGVTDAGIMDIYTQAINSDPAAKDMDPTDLAKIVVQTATQIKDSQNKPALPTVQIAGQRQPVTTSPPEDVSTQVPDTYTAPVAKPGNLNPANGTIAQNAYGDINPTDTLHKQFALADYGSNTAKQKAAEEEYARRAAVNRPGQSAGQLAMGMGGEQVVNAYEAQQKARDEMDKYQTTGKVTREQEFAKSGIELYKQGLLSAGEVIGQLEKSGKFDIDAKAAQLAQKKLQLELVGQGANTQVTQALMDAKSPNSIAVRNDARYKLKMAGYTDDQVKQLVPDTMTGIEAGPIAVAAKSALDAQKTKAETAQSYGVAAQGQGIGEHNVAGAAQTRLGTKVLGTVTEGGTKLPPGLNTSISVGGITAQPSPLVTGAQTAGAAEDANGRVQSAIASKYGIDALTGSLIQRTAADRASNKFPATGRVQEWLAKVTPGESERIKVAIQSLANARSAYAAAGGAPAVKVDDEVQRIMSLSPTAFQTELLTLNEQVARQEDRQKAYTKYIQEKGTATGFDDTQTKSKVYLYNTKTGERGLASPDKVTGLKKKGFVEINELNR